MMFFLCSLNQVASEMHYITATAGDCSSAVLCETLHRFASNNFLSVIPNTTLIFLPGRHFLTINLTFSNLDHFLAISENLTAQIECTPTSHIFFNHSQHIHITNLDFVGCGGIQVKNVDEFMLKGINLHNTTSGAALELMETTAHISNCTVTFNTMGNAAINESVIYAGGVLFSISSNVTIKQSKFENNRADYGGAIIYAEERSIIDINDSVFIGNSALYGILCCNNSNVAIEASKFEDNNRGTITSYNSVITVGNSSFESNINQTLKFENCTIIINSSMFSSNVGEYGGPGLVSFARCTVMIVASIFHKTTGAVLYSNISTVILDTSKFDNNTRGMATVISYYSPITIQNCNFTNNNPLVAVITAFSSRIELYGSLLLADNFAYSHPGFTLLLAESEFIKHQPGKLTVSNNLGSMLGVNSNITFFGYVLFINNGDHSPLSQFATDVHNQGGAITLLHSNIFFDGMCNLEHNRADDGGAILSRESKLYVNGDLTIAHNVASRNGAGIYLSNSELIYNDKSTFLLFNNTAKHKGGGLHAISSSIKVSLEKHTVTSRLSITENKAEKGGGLFLEANAKLYYVLKGRKYNLSKVLFMGNIADYGGAIYVNDDSYSGACAIVPRSECFFQVLVPYLSTSDKTQMHTVLSFSQNLAHISGFTLYGGLLDRCAMSQFAEIQLTNYYWQQYVDGLAYFKGVSTFTNLSLSSGPVQVCFCINNEHNCSLQSHTVWVKKGEAFKVSLVAIDQVHNPVNASIQASLNFTGSDFDEAQLTRNIPAECSDLIFNIFSPHNSETLMLYAENGPCKDADLSKRTVDVRFLPCDYCPLGLQLSKTNCTCECHSDISEYVEQCNIYTGAFIRGFQSRTWITYINSTNGMDGYLVYPNCPFDYCSLKNVLVDLNQPNGADTQCAFNRSSLLCGSCQPLYSLSLSSSRCLPCPHYWPALLIIITIATILAGIALVALLLMLNMTVAIGTLNGLIFYANVVYAYKSILLQFQEINFITVFLSWLNLEMGIDTCYFPGMDTYVKIWIQLGFPSYIILLVVLVIILSSYSPRFSNFIGRRDPVATLATLLLLSYAKLLEICFKSFAYGKIAYPDGSIRRLWLPDATVRYIIGKHALIFIIAVLILLVGLLYTALVLSWQWLLHLPNWKMFRWTRDQKLKTFIETYHIPYTPKHRYWIGLLLLVRVILYLAVHHTSISLSNDPTISLTTLTFTIICVLALKGLIGRRIYRKVLVDILDTFFYWNILFLAVFTWYSLDKQNRLKAQNAVAYTSVVSAFIVLLLVILYHVYTYTPLFSKFEKTKVCKLMFEKLHSRIHKSPQSSPPPDDDNHRFNELLDIIDYPVNNDYQVSALASGQKSAKPTKSVVEIREPSLTSPSHENIHHIAAEIHQ